MSFYLKLKNPKYSAEASSKLKKKFPKDKVEKAIEKKTSLILKFLKSMVKNLTTYKIAKKDIIVLSTVRKNGNVYHSDRNYNANYEIDNLNVLPKEQEIKFNTAVDDTLKSIARRKLDDLLYDLGKDGIRGFKGGFMMHPIEAMMFDMISRLEKNSKTNDDSERLKFINSIDAKLIAESVGEITIEMYDGFYSTQPEVFGGQNYKTNSFNAIFIIPKGSKYYSNEKQLISNKIILKRVLGESSISDRKIVLQDLGIKVED